MKLYRVMDRFMNMRGHCLVEGDLVGLTPAGEHACRNLIAIRALAPLDEEEANTLEVILGQVLIPSWPALPGLDRTSHDSAEMILR